MIIVLLFIMVANCDHGDTDKTLVAWIKFNDLSVTGGSVLTIQNNDQFDGIVFAEKEAGKWIAGSDNWNRTMSDFNNVEPETTDNLGKMIQMAIVYEKNSIRIYRNGILYSNYDTENIDLLDSKNNVVVFGLRHLGGVGSVSCEIEDARIYRRALSSEDINELEPNVQSDIQPYAWWDFEGNEIKERTGRYKIHVSGDRENAAQRNGKLVLKRWGTLIALRKYIRETPEWPKNPPNNWMTFHLAHPGPGKAEPGDPNAAYFYKGRYHLHYIYDGRYGFSYAHVSSEDMVYWKWHFTTLTPIYTGHGMFSGTGFFTREGRPAMIYHGFFSGRNQLSYSMDDDLNEWRKPEPIVPKNEKGELPRINHWDPDCWLKGDTYYAISGGKDPELMKSNDLKYWYYLGKLLHDDFPEYVDVDREDDISCANMFKIGKKWMLLCINHTSGCRYFLGDFRDEKYRPEFHAKMNWINTDWEKGHSGLVYFAPESMLTEDGRRVMWAWVMGNIAPTGVQSLPRELELPDDGILRIKPLEELEKLRYDEITHRDIKITSDDTYCFKEVTGDAVELKITFSAPLPEKFGISMLGDENGREGMRIIAGRDLSTIQIGSIKPPFQLKENENLTLRIFIDKNLVEVFINNRQAAVFAHKYIRENPNIFIYTEDKELFVKEARAWKMKSIYEGNTVFSSE